MDSKEIFFKMREDNKKQEEELAKKIMDGNENLRNTLAKIKRDMEKISIHSNVNYDSFQPQNYDNNEINYVTFQYNNNQYDNYQFGNNNQGNLNDIKEVKEENNSNYTPNYKQESTEFTYDKSTSKFIRDSPNSHNYKLSEGSLTDNNTISQKEIIDKNNEKIPINNKIINQRTIMNSTSHIPDENLRNQKIKIDIKPNINKNYGNINNEDSYLKQSKTVDSNKNDVDLENQIIYNNNSNSNFYKNNINVQSSNEDIVNSSQEQFNQTNKGNYNTFNHTQDLSNYNINNEKNTTSTFYQGEKIINGNKINQYNSNNNLINNENINYNNNIENPNENYVNEYRKIPLKNDHFISYKKEVEKPKTNEKITMAQKEFMDLKNEIDLLKKEKEFIKNSIEKTGYNKPVDLKKIERKNQMVKNALKKKGNYEQVKNYENRLMESLNKNDFYFDDDYNKDDFGKYVDNIINRSLKAYKYRHCNNCSRLLTNGKSCGFCKKKHHLYRRQTTKK